MTSGPSLIDQLKTRLKSGPRFYYFLVKVLGPMLYQDRSYQRLCERVPPGQPILHLGCGPLGLDAPGRVVNVDIHPYPNVSVRADAGRLPFPDGCAGGVISIALLEHVAAPEAVVAEIRRVLRPGGCVYTATPFMCGYHASPEDFRRYTLPGLKRLFAGFEEVAAGCHSGPTSAVLSVGHEWLALLLSCGSRRLYELLWAPLLLLAAPFKVLDYWLARHPEAHRVSASLYYICRKPAA